MDNVQRSEAERSPRPLPLVVRRRQARAAARARVAARTTRDLTPAQRARDPLALSHLTRRGRVLRAIAAIIGSAIAHIAVVAAGFGVRELGEQLPRQEVAIEVREREPPPPPPPPPPEPEPEPEPEPPKVVERPNRLPPETPPEPPPEPKAPPPRVVGLSLESTTEGGGGPAFAVGNTREGKTAERAVDPKLVPTEAPATDKPPEANQVASRIPMAGVVRTAPKRKQPSEPPYPEVLRAQALEADVTVLVSVSADGKVTDVKVLKPSPYPEFNEAAKQHALKEEYEPATKNGEPVATSLSFTYRFRLQDQ